MRLAVINKDLCKSTKCSLECVNTCPINRAGNKCVYIGEDKFSKIDEELCIGCGICVKKCPFKAITVVNTPEKLKESPIHRFGQNSFMFFRLPYPIKGKVVGLLGPNGVGKTTALNVLSGNIKPNMGQEKINQEELIKMFRGTELQNHLESLSTKKIVSVVKPQQIDILSQVKGTVNDILEKHNEKGTKEEIIKKLSLTSCLNRELSKLSGGELQRVAIAIAALRKADIYYFDEPTSYLDVFQRMETGKLIRELAKDAAVLVVEHDLATLDFLADRIHIFYGVPATYGIVSNPYSTKNGINAFLDGYIKDDNTRIREDSIDFKLAKSASTAEPEIYLEWTDIEKDLGDFSLEIKAGHINKSEILGIFGSNALGKTTFARILSGELKIDKGKIEKQSKISYKPQYISNDFDGTVIELLSTISKNPYSDDYKSEIIKPLSLEKLLESDIKNLSGGEMQRVAIAVCLSKKAEIYLLDEPSAFLDSEQRMAVAKLIRKFCELHECSAMIIDHDLLFLSYLSDRALLFEGEPGIKGSARKLNLQEGFNEFLKKVDITFRKDPENARPRANKPGSQKDQEQKNSGTYFHV